MKNGKVAIIVLNWNQKEDTACCLESLGNIDYANAVTIVVDNGSMDGSVADLRDRFPGVIWLQNDENLGYAEGNNVGIRYALENLQPEYLLVLNNDTVVDRHFLSELVRVAETDERIGIVGPKIYYYHEPRVINSAGAEMLWRLGVHRNIGIGQYEFHQYNTVREVDCAHGCAFLVKTRVIEEVGEFDRRFFLILEETDLCIRARKAGYRIMYTPGSIVYHKEGISGKRSYAGVYYSHRNRMLLIRKNYSIPSIVACAVPLVAVFLLTIGYYCYRRDPKMVSTLGRAYYDGITMR